MGMLESCVGAPFPQVAAARCCGFRIGAASDDRCVILGRALPAELTVEKRAQLRKRIDADLRRADRCGLPFRVGHPTRNADELAVWKYADQIVRRGFIQSLMDPQCRPSKVMPWVIDRHEAMTVCIM